MNVSGLSLKEAMEAIEERIPYGHRVVKLVLALATLAIIVWLWKFLYGNLVFPALAWASSWWGIPLPFRRSTAYIADVVVGLMIAGMIILAASYATTKLGRLMEKMETLLRSFRGEFDEIDNGLRALLALGGEFDTSLKKLDDRVSALENKKQDIDVSTST